VAQHQQVVRVDWEDAAPLKEMLAYRVISFIKKNLKRYNAVIIEDYGKGIINANFLKHIIPLIRKNKKIITVDPKEEHFSLYKKVTAITPNLKEAENAIRDIKMKDIRNSLRVNIGKITDNQIDKVGKELSRYLELKALLITLGEKGMRLFQQDKQPLQIDTVAQDVFDVTGAGDTVIAVFTLSLASGASFTEAAYLANSAAGIVVGKLGTATISVKELRDKIKTL
jgi:rfaE bifunctional protein kinase chain/domain